MAKQSRKMGDIVCLGRSYWNESYDWIRYDQKVPSKVVNYWDKLRLDIYGFGLPKSIYWPIKSLLHIIRPVEGVRRKMKAL